MTCQAIASSLEAVQDCLEMLNTEVCVCVCVCVCVTERERESGIESEYDVVCVCVTERERKSGIESEYDVVCLCVCVCVCDREKLVSQTMSPLAWVTHHSSGQRGKQGLDVHLKGGR